MEFIKKKRSNFVSRYVASTEFISKRNRLGGGCNRVVFDINIGDRKLAELNWRVLNYQKDLSKKVSNLEEQVVRNISDIMLLSLPRVDFDSIREILCKEIHVDDNVVKKEENEQLGKFNKFLKGFSPEELKYIDIGSKSKVRGSVNNLSESLEEDVGILSGLIDKTEFNGDLIKSFDELREEVKDLKDRLKVHDRTREEKRVRLIFTEMWEEVKESGFLIDWSTLYDKFIDWQRELGFFTFTKFAKRIGLLKEEPQAVEKGKRGRPKKPVVSINVEMLENQNLCDKEIEGIVSKKIKTRKKRKSSVKLEKLEEDFEFDDFLE